MAEQKYICGSLFEEDYLVRSLGSSITSQPEVALTELVANAWDAGATHVNIFIPEKHGDILIVEDDGIGLTEKEFQERWMTLRYNRLKRQGRKVVFPDGGHKGCRIAYGKNGVGRHGLLCFNDEYRVQTSKDGKLLSLTISTKVKEQAIAITDEQISDTIGHGTRLEVTVIRNLPQVARIREIIAARFLHDPEFIIEINGQVLQLDELNGLLDTRELTTKDGIKLVAHFVDSKKTSRKSIYQGIAFWQHGRLVGVPDWVLGKIWYMDGRTILAKRYTVVIQSNDLENIIKEDWSGFKDVEETNNMYITVAEYVDEMFKYIAQATVEETKAAIKKEFQTKLKNVSPLTLYEVDEVIESIAISSPTAKQESISIAVEAVVNLEKTKNGQDLLAKLSQLSDEDIAGLNQLLEKWSIKDALIVLNEIDRRISIIEAIRKLSKDKTIDELHILHPLVSESRWLFGPEYDSAEYTFNRQMQTVVKQLFDAKPNFTKDIKITKRPDIVVLADDSTISFTGTEDYTQESDLVEINKVLIIELKRGGFEIKRNERNQVQGYVEDLYALGYNNACITAFVVGDTIAGELLQSRNLVIPNDKGPNARIFVTTFSQLVDTAEKRMFGLRDKLSSMYEDIPGMELYRQAKLNLKE